MKLVLTHPSPNHAVICDEDNEAHPWIATINTANAPGRAEAVLAALNAPATVPSQERVDAHLPQAESVAGAPERS